MNLSAVFVLTKAILRKNASFPSANIPIIIFPILELLLYGFLGASASSPLSSTDSFILGALLWVSLYRSQQEITSVVYGEVNSKNLKNIFSSPLSINDYISALMLSSFIKFIFTFIIYMMTSFLLFKLNIFKNELFLFVLFNFILFGWTLGIITAGLAIRFGNKAAFLVWFTSFFLYPFMSIYYATDSISYPFRFISYALPVSHIMNYMRGTEHVAVGVSLNIFYFIASLFILRLLFKSSLQKGVFYFQ